MQLEMIKIHIVTIGRLVVHTDYIQIILKIFLAAMGLSSLMNKFINKVNKTENWKEMKIQLNVLISMYMTQLTDYKIIS